MLEPQAENQWQLVEHHRRQAALNFEAGDKRGAYWHGRKAQAAIREAKEQESIAGVNTQDDAAQPIQPEESHEVGA